MTFVLGVTATVDSHIHGDVTARSAPVTCGQGNGYVTVTVISVELG